MPLTYQGYMNGTIKNNNPQAIDVYNGSFSTYPNAGTTFGGVSNWTIVGRTVVFSIPSGKNY